MAKKWEGSKVIEEIDEALDRATAQFLTNTQSKLSAASPVLTGRLASSWNIGRNRPDRKLLQCVRNQKDHSKSSHLVGQSPMAATGLSAATCPTPAGCL